MTLEHQQQANGSMTYPEKGTLNRVLFKLPLLLWRMGLGPILSHPNLGGSKMLVLTTWGRVTGAPRHTMLSYLTVGGKQFVASGWGKRSDWVKNIAANPHVTVQVRAKTFVAEARRIVGYEEFAQITREMFESGGDTHFESWLESFGIAFNPDDMLAKRERLFLVGLDPCDGSGPAPMEVDLVWMWGLFVIPVITRWLKNRLK